jgi:hypothetical protein
MTGIETSPAVRSVRRRIDAVVSREERVEILDRLGCHELTSFGSIRRAGVPRTAQGAELLAAIDALDRACCQGGDDEVETAGDQLVELWARHRQA